MKKYKHLIIALMPLGLFLAFVIALFFLFKNCNANRGEIMRDLGKQMKSIEQEFKKGYNDTIK
jgi:hypothetical protein